MYTSSLLYFKLYLYLISSLCIVSIFINLWFIILHIYSSFSPSPNIFLSLFSYPLKYPIIIFTISLGIFSIFSYILSKILIQIYFIHLDHFHDNIHITFYTFRFINPIKLFHFFYFACFSQYFLQFPFFPYIYCIFPLF